MLILASGSPRRKELLGYITGDFTVIPAKGEENADKSLPPEEFVKENAKNKAREIHALHPDDTVIGADTIVYLEGDILGKPRDSQNAAEMLRRLSGKTHSVFTGVCVVSPEGEKLFAEETKVEFYELSDKEIDAYVRTGDPLDKAGAYGIQEKGSLLIKGIQGDYYNVMGLPIGRLSRSLA